MRLKLKSLSSTFGTPFLRLASYRIKNSPLGYRVAKGILWSAAGTVISRGMMFVSTILVARILGKMVYGELGMIQSTIGVFGVLAGFGLGLTATKHVAEFRQINPAKVGRILGLSRLFAMVTGGLMAFGLFIFAPWLAKHTINAPHLAGVLRIGTLILFISALTCLQTGALAGFEAFKTITRVNFYVGLISFPVIVCGAWLGSLTGTVWALAINFGIYWLFNHIALRKEARRHNVPFCFKECSREWAILWKFSLPAVLAGAVVSPANWTARAFLANQTDGYIEIGILTAALVFKSLLHFVGNMLTDPLLSVISNEKPGKSDKLEKVNVLSSWILGVMMSIPMLCFPEIAQVLFGKDYSTYGFKVTFSLVVFCSSILMYKSGLTRKMVANNIIWLGFFSNFLWAIILIVTTFFLVHWGAVGLAVSLSIAYIFQTLIVLPICYTRKLIPKWTFFSLESALIWFVIVSLVFLNIINISIIFRSIAFVPSILLVGFAFIKIGRGVAAQ